ncbi:hypothetical protein PV327_010930 [Microctonus hyperodae]|uniref:Uncharacterized protein n=1 Tax=Microctonus hyperodae TaxID=165561 RepID=A0AA39C8H3_MICHY|nr:hypothetical protein PV327_010930 [Microctonus hyperodae]
MEALPVPDKLVTPPTPMELDPETDQIVKEIGEEVASMAKGRISPIPRKTKIPVIQSRYRNARGNWQLGNSEDGVSVMTTTKKPAKKIVIRPYVGAVSKAVTTSVNTIPRAGSPRPSTSRIVKTGVKPKKQTKKPQIRHNEWLQQKIPLKQLKQTLTQPVVTDPREGARVPVPSTKMITPRSLKKKTTRKESARKAAPPTTQVVMPPPAEMITPQESV